MLAILRGLSEDRCVVAERDLERIAKLLVILDARHADARSEAARLHVHGKPRKLREVRADSVRAVEPARTRHHRRRRAPGCPAPRSVVRDRRLSMLTAAEATSQPQYGIAASSKSPCRVPSSPLDPCTSGIATSKRAAARGRSAEQSAPRLDLEELPAAGRVRAHRDPCRRGDQSIDVLVAIELEQLRRRCTRPRSSRCTRGPGS